MPELHQADVREARQALVKVENVPPHVHESLSDLDRQMLDEQVLPDGVLQQLLEPGHLDGHVRQLDEYGERYDEDEVAEQHPAGRQLAGLLQGRDEGPPAQLSPVHRRQFFCLVSICVYDVVRFEKYTKKIK